MPETRTGGCQCGTVRYECAAEPVELYVCHCTECRRQSASAFGISYYVKATDITLTGGNPVYWERGADSGNRVSCAFCPRCGSRLWHCDPEIRLLVGKAPGAADETYVSVKGGSLDDPVDFAKAVHIWTASKIPGMKIPEGAVQFPGEPPTDEYP